MTANYPGSLPVDNPAGSTLDADPHSVLHDSLYDEIVAIATELGTAASGTSDTVADRMALLDQNFTLASYAPTVTKGSAMASCSTTDRSGYYIVTGDVVWFWFKFTINEYLGDTVLSGDTTDDDVYLSITVPVTAVTDSVAGDIHVFKEDTTPEASPYYRDSISAFCLPGSSTYVHMTPFGYGYDYGKWWQYGPYAWDLPVGSKVNGWIIYEKA